MSAISSTLCRSSKRSDIPENAGPEHSSPIATPASSGRAPIVFTPSQAHQAREGGLPIPGATEPSAENRPAPDLPDELWQAISNQLVLSGDIGLATRKAAKNDLNSMSSVSLSMNAVVKTVIKDSVAGRLHTNYHFRLLAQEEVGNYVMMGQALEDSYFFEMVEDVCNNYRHVDIPLNQFDLSRWLPLLKKILENPHWQCLYLEVSPEKSEFSAQQFFMRRSAEASFDQCCKELTPAIAALATQKRRIVLTVSSMSTGPAFADAMENNPDFAKAISVLS